MKILVITDLYPVKIDEKNTPKTIYDFVQGWKTMGHEVSIIKPNFLLNSFIRKKPFYKTGLYDDVENLNYFLPFCNNVSEKMKTNPDEFDIIIAHMPSGILFANKLNLPFTAGVHVSDIEVLTNPIYSVYFKPRLEKAYKNASKIACRSDILKTKFLKLYPEYSEKTFVAFSGINEKYITERIWIKKNTYNIITCANLIKRKNIDKLILACKNIKNITLTIIGDGEELNKLKKLAAPMKEKIFFEGHLSHEKTLEKMREADIFVLPSQNETFGMVYLESMASGCVTVGLKNDGIDGIIKNEENGFLTTLDTLEADISNIIEKDNTEILRNANETIKNYTIQKACSNYIENILK